MRLTYEIGITEEAFWGLESPTVHASNGHAVSRSRTRQGLQFLRYCDWHDDFSWQPMLRKVCSHLTNSAGYLDDLRVNVASSKRNLSNKRVIRSWKKRSFVEDCLVG